MTDYQFRPATAEDVPAIAAIYDKILAADNPTGWEAGVYPTEKTAADAIACGDMFVLCRGEAVLAAARLNHDELPVYAETPWVDTAAPGKVLVIHTLVVDPAARGQGLARRFVGFYEEEARRLGCPNLRMDTNLGNIPARTLYKSQGFREAAVITAEFNGIAGTPLVLLEKRLG